MLKRPRKMNGRQLTRGKSVWLFAVEVRAERSYGTPRLGQEPPPMPEEQEYDPRSLFEVRFFYLSD
jgi:hypothetical protein